MFDLLIRNGTLANSTGLKIDLVIADGEVVAMEKDFSGKARQEIDATGLHIFPQLIDSHLHFNEPGRADWEGFETGTRALAAGGITLFFDMPLNAHPPTIDAESFNLKLAAAKKSSLVDFAFWGGLVPGNLDKLDELADCGVIGFKAFMADSGIDDFSCVDDWTLREGMKRAAKLNLPVAVHAESEVITKQLAREFINGGCTSVRDYLNSRPDEAELDAIRRALEMAGETKCKLHIVHVSCGAGMALIAEAKKRGVDVSCETCPHYLTLTDDDVEKLGAVAKCAPPLRSARDQEGLWQFVSRGDLPMTIGSDHSPAPPEMKTNANFFKVWGGISGAQHTLPILITEGHFKRNVEIMSLWFALSKAVGQRFNLTLRGDGMNPFPANFALVDLNETFEVKRDELFYRHKQSPYIGRKLRGKIVRTFLRGQTIYHDGKIVAKPAGRLVKPQR